MSTKRRIAMAATLAAVFGATVSVVQWGPSVAQFTGGGTQVEVVGDVQLAEPVNVMGDVQAYPPDGGVDVHILTAPRLEATVSTDPGTWLAVANDSTGTRLQAEVTGPSGGPVTVDGAVAVTGTVAITAQSIAALNGRFCVPGAQNKQGVTGTVVGLPPIPGDGGTGAQQGRTSISLSYPDQAGTTFLACYASGLSGGTDPVCTLPVAGAITVGPQLPQGGVLELEVSDAYVLRCLACTAAGAASGATVIVSYVEQDCNQ